MARGDNFKGKKPEGSGRKKGQVTKVTADVRMAISALLQRNFEEFQKRLGEIKDPKHYCDVFLKVAEFNIPKLAKVEQTVRHATNAEQMSDDELAAVAGVAVVTGSGDAAEAGESRRTH